jgi:hypothetical protein
VECSNAGQGVVRTKQTQKRYALMIVVALLPFGVFGVISWHFTTLKRRGSMSAS